MTWITVVWSMVASACLVFTLIHAFVWARRISRIVYLLFSITALSVGVLAFMELAMMRAHSAEQYALLVRWAHVPVFVVLVSMVGFIQAYLCTGRWWLLWAVVSLRGLVLILNFASDLNVNYAAINAIQRLTLWGGEEISVVDVTPNALTYLATASSLLVVVFVLDAAITAWRRGNRRKALVVPGSTALFITSTTIHAALIHGGVIQSPYLISIGYLTIILAISWELSNDLVHVADTTEQLQYSQAELVETKLRMQLAADAAQLGMWVWDVPRDDVWITDTGRAMFDLGRTERLTFAAVVEAVHPEDRQRFQQEVRQSLERCADYQSEFRVAPLQRGERWIAAHGRVECNGSGRPVRIRGISIDITRRKRDQLEADRNRAELAHLSRVATLGELSGSIAHELNQPLAAILCNAQAAQRFLAREVPDQTELGEILADIVEQDKHASNVIQRLRVLVKRGEIQRVPVDINRVVHDMIDLMHHVLISRGVTVQTCLADGLPVVCGDAVQIQQVLINLVVNACDAMADIPAPDRWLRIGTDRDDDRHVTIWVGDNGCGIPPDRLEAIFEPFVSTKPAGMGLGLAVSRTIISAHGGRVWATNNDRGGACFHVSVPVDGVPVS